MKQKIYGIVLLSVMVASNIFGASSDDAITAPLPPAFHAPALFDALLALDFLNKDIMVKTGLFSKATMSIQDDWKRTVLVQKNKDQEKNNTIDTKKNAERWVAEVYDSMVAYLQKKPDAQDHFEKLYVVYLASHPEINAGVSKRLFAQKKYADFIKSDVLKIELFKIAMTYLGYAHQPVKSTKDHEKVEKIEKEIKQIEEQLVEQQNELDSFEINVDEHSSRSGIVRESDLKIQKIMDQMNTEKKQLNALKAQIAKEMVEPEQHKKRSGWSIMTNAKAVEILIEQPLQADHEQVAQAAQKLLDVDESSSREAIEQAFAAEMEQIAQMKNNVQRKKYEQAAKVAEQVLISQQTEPLTKHTAISNQVREFAKQEGLKIAQQLLAAKKTVQDSNFAKSDWSPQEVAYLMGYVQSCMQSLQGSQALDNSEATIARVAEVLKIINVARQARS